MKGIILKQKLQENNIKIEDAAKSLGISRQSLSLWFKREKIGRDIIADVKDKLGIDLISGDSKEETVPVGMLLKTKDELIERLKEQLSDKTEIINLLKANK